MRNLRIIFNDRPLRSAPTGVGHYLRQLMLHLATLDPDLQLDPFLLRYIFRRDWRDQLHAEAAAAAATEGQPPPQPQRRKPWWLRAILDKGLAAAFRQLARPRRYDLYHEANHIPLPCDLPTITTVHDLSVLLHPEWHPADRVRWYAAGFERGLRLTRHFIAASEFTKQQMIRHCGLPADRITVTYQAPRAAFAPQPPETVQRTLAALHLPPRFLMYVGTLEPRKNVSGLLEAYAALPQQVRNDHPLVIAGAWGWKHDALQAQITAAHLAPHVRLIGYTADATLACLYSACTALVWPTYYEGFGLPPLEALACGAGAIVSDVASLPEVVGDAGVRLPPDDTTAWTAAMTRMCADDAWREERRAAGRAQAARFSWERCARETLTCYQRVAGA